MVKSFLKSFLKSSLFLFLRVIDKQKKDVKDENDFVEQHGDQRPLASLLHLGRTDASSLETEKCVHERMFLNEHQNSRRPDLTLFQHLRNQRRHHQVDGDEGKVDRNAFDWGRNWGICLMKNENPIKLSNFEIDSHQCTGCWPNEIQFQWIWTKASKSQCRLREVRTQTWHEIRWAARTKRHRQERPQSSKAVRPCKDKTNLSWSIAPQT